MSLNYSKLLSDSKYNKLVTIDDFDLTKLDQIECTNPNNFNIIKVLKEDSNADDLDCLHYDYQNKTYNTFYGLLEYFFYTEINNEINKLNLKNFNLLNKVVLQEEIMILFCHMNRLRLCRNDLKYHSKISYRIDFSILTDEDISDCILIDTFIKEQYNEFNNNNKKELNLFYVISRLIDKLS
jgi:hypothetical protein